MKTEAASGTFSVHKSIFAGCALIAASILIGFLLLGAMLRGPGVESEADSDAYKFGYDDGSSTADSGTVEEVCSADYLTISDRQPTPKETNDWVAGCRAGYADH